MAFPGTRAFVAALGIGLPKITSGFQGGIRDIRIVEERLSPNQPLALAEDDCLSIGQYSERKPSRERGLTEAELWMRQQRANPENT